MSAATSPEDTAGFISFQEIWEFHTGGKHRWTAHDVRERLRSKTAEGFFEGGDRVRVFNVPGHSGRLDPEVAEDLRGFVDQDRNGEPSMALHLFNCCCLSRADYLRFCDEFGITPQPSRRLLSSIVETALIPIPDDPGTPAQANVCRLLRTHKHWRNGVPPAMSSREIAEELNSLRPPGDRKLVSQDAVDRVLGRRR